jgi:hypothetical protein
MNKDKTDKEGQHSMNVSPNTGAQQDTQQGRHGVTYLEKWMQKFSYTYLRIHAEIGLNINDTSDVPEEF